ncbi:outer membrane receptor protein involved in Fe transport [Chryseobacterium bernardetii]|uniref:Outer membrane beta-barrel protein n=2 Tax=Chryseobacterium TaxID=59732 RepID=A0A543ENR3_9FLAO|nr:MULTISPECIES: TonB-dependent receptor [Chryseobacterium]MDR6369622.1 outer membrane receptor protein involved in Fe transport [Chryseobacterium vietnamense]MDR6439456.1 outer membrane receptor protein involved in Fe transport [Chryseobacterium bernardetii]TQM23228.1 outer membrane beta-barrel protein [Chryseobacterium aquifrigidense]
MKKTIYTILFLCSAFMFSQEKKNDTVDAVVPKEIQEVILKSQRKKQFADKAVYTFDKEALDRARYAKDLLSTLPELQLNPVENTITSTKGGTTLFLINGIEATDMQIRSVAPTEVVKVEYYDIPPARWATRADTVVNILTKSTETGYVFGADVSTALNTGFVNGSAYANYTKGKNNFGLEYSLNVRDYDDRRVNSIYDYQLNGKHYRSDENRKDHFGYTFQNVALRYTRLVPDDYAFQAKLNMDIFSRFSKGVGQSAFTEDNLKEEHSMFKNNGSDYVIPKLDLYYSKKMGEKDELSINIVGSHYTTNTTETAKEWIVGSGLSVYDNDMVLKAKQTSLVGELAHVHDFTAGKLSSGYRISRSSISNDLNNLSGSSQYSVNYLEQYFYTEFSGKVNKFSYRIGAGLTNIHNKSAENTFDEWTFTPKVILAYQIKGNQNLRFTASYNPVSPWSNALSSNVVQLAPNIVQRGNPFLKSQQVFSNNLNYSFNNKYFDFNAGLFYRYTNRVINQYYVQDELLNGYALTYENGKNAQRYGVQLTGSYKPFGNSLLVIKAVITPTSETVRTSKEALIKNNYLGNYFSLSSEYKSFSVQYQFNIPVYSLSGAFLNTNENQNNIFLSYKRKNWTFSTGMYWIGMPSEYKTKSLPESLVDYKVHTQIMNNKSMFVVGLSYDFSKGKKTEIQRKLNNDTAPAATF